MEPEITYDFTLPITHRFWSNGFISHNSGKSAVTAMMTAYMIHRVAKLSKPNEVYGLLHSNILHGTFCALSFGMAKDLLYDPLYGYLIDAPWFCLSFDSPVSLNDGTKKPICDIRKGDYVKTFEGQSEVTTVFDNGFKECFEVTLENEIKLEGTEGHLIQCLSEDGSSLTWKRVADLTEDDYVVIE